MISLRFFLILFILSLLMHSTVLAQKHDRDFPAEKFKTKGEVYFTFQINGKSDLEKLTRIISLDNVQGNQVFAYANEQEFKNFLRLGYTYQILTHPGDLLDESQLRSTGAGEGILTTWDFYPSYDQYINYMNEFVVNYPEICKLVFIGYSILGRELIAVKISDNVNEEEAEPQVLYTSSMHGNETTGYITMLHLIDYLLSNYGTDPRITGMVDHTEIFINPLANPDGTYWTGNSSVYGAIRYNANFVDLNRNYPDPEDGPHPDGNEWQAETSAFMDFAEDNHFVLSANFHGGAEVVNYPWDTWAQLAADDDWWQYVSHEYADTAHTFSPPGYMSGFNNGITNGYEWYEINGGRQDYMNYFHFCREVTIEISNASLLPASQLLNHWEYNYRSLLNYIEQAGFGLQGIVTDSVTGEPLQAVVFIPSHDTNNSQVYTKLPSGYYSRLLNEGQYDIQFAASGYFPKIISGVNVVNRTTTSLDVQLVPTNIGLEEQRNERITMAYPNPSDGHIRLVLPETGITQAQVECYSMKGVRVFNKSLYVPESEMSVKMDLSHLAGGLYLLRLSTNTANYTDRIIIR